MDISHKGEYGVLTASHPATPYSRLDQPPPRKPVHESPPPRSRLPAPYLSRIWPIPSPSVTDTEAYPFCLPFLHDDFELDFRPRHHHHRRRERHRGNRLCSKGSPCSPAMTKPAAARATGRSTTHWARGGNGRQLLDRRCARAGCRKITHGWFFRAESFFTVARYLDEAARGPLSGPPPDFLSHSHGEGFLRFFEERCQRQGIFIFDEPESALSPARQIEFLKLLRPRWTRLGHLPGDHGDGHAPMLMAYPGARLLGLTNTARPGNGRGDPAFPDHPGVLCRLGDVRGDDDGGVSGALKPPERIATPPAGADPQPSRQTASGWPLLNG